jgi:hypothetical protein
MSSNVYTAGLRNVGSYQVSGHPYLSGSDTPAGTAFSSSVFVFPYVSKTITVSNENSVTGACVSFVPYLSSQATAEGFTKTSSGGHWLYIAPNSSIELNVKSEKIYVGSTTTGKIEVSVFAELTNIPVARMYSFDGLEGISS